jgi:hypothetical protein
VRSSEIASEHSIIREKFFEHRFGGQSILIVISDSMLPGYVSDGAHRISTELPGVFGNWIGHREQLIAMFVDSR